MQFKSLLKLFIVAFVLSIISIAVIFSSYRDTNANKLIIGHHLIKNFTKMQLERIEISSPNGESVLLSKSEKGRWVVVDSYSYPADPQKIDDLLESLNELKIVQVINKNSDTLDALGFKNADKTDGDDRIDVKLIGKHDKILASFVLGKSRLDAINGYQINKGRYVYSNGLFVLVDDPLGEIQYKDSYWINSSLVSINDIESMKLERANKEIWEVIRTKIDSNFTLVNQSEDRVVNQKSVSRILESLENLQFYSIADPSLSSTYMGLNSPYSLKITTFSGKSYTLFIGGENSLCRYVKLESNGIMSEWTYLIKRNRVDPLIISLKDISSLTRSDKEKYHTFSAPIS